MSAAAMRGFGPSRFPQSIGPATPADTRLDNIATGSADNPGGDLMHPNNPLLAFAVIAAVTFGLMAFSTSVRVGKAKGTLTIGDPK